jgi:cytochrome c oxidase cbb3-type subunit 3
MSDSHQHQQDHADGIIEAEKGVPGYFYVLFFGLMIWGIIFMAYYLLSGWSSADEFQAKMAVHSGAPPQAQAQTPAVEAPAAAAPPGDGKALFAANCAGCHGADASGGFGSDLTAAGYQYGKSADEIRTSINAGRGDNMPAFAEQLSAAEIDKLVDFLLQL